MEKLAAADWCSRGASIVQWLRRAAPGREVANEAGTRVLKHGSTGLYLAPDGEWTADSRLAHRFTDDYRAGRLIQRHACEIQAFELVVPLDAN
jgi:hypothetical protein